MNGRGHIYTAFCARSLGLFYSSISQVYALYGSAENLKVNLYDSRRDDDRVGVDLYEIGQYINICRYVG